MATPGFFRFAGHPPNIWHPPIYQVVPKSRAPLETLISRVIFLYYQNPKDLPPKWLVLSLHSLFGHGALLAYDLFFPEA
jgi:hypothetical protein